MVCDACGTPDGRSKFKTVQSFLSHVSQHIKDEAYIPYDGPRICALCTSTDNKQYASFPSLKKHIYGIHGYRRDFEKEFQLTERTPTTSDTNLPEIPVLNFEQFIDLDYPDFPDLLDDKEPTTQSNCYAFSDALFESVMDRAIDLECNPSMNRINANIAIKSLIETLESVCNNIALAVGTITSAEDAVHMASQIERIPEQLAVLKTEHKRHMHYVSRQYLIKPESRILDEQPETRHNNGTGSLHFKKTSIESVSLTTLLSTLFASKEFCSQLLWPSDFNDSNDLSHPFSGSRAHDLKDQLKDDFIAIEEYGDEFETCNPLGSKKGKHKVMGKYCRVLNLGPHVSSTLMQIFLYLIGSAADFKDYRESVMSWSLDEFKQLEESGIWAYDKHGNYRRIRVVLFSSVGDNLYANEASGLQMSFGNGRPCRGCPLPYNELVKLCSLDGTTLRSRESYDAALNRRPQDTGIHRQCVLNDLKFFHCMDALVFDPMHDIAHGHGTWFLKRMLKSVIVDNNVLSLIELNTLIEEFPFHGKQQSTKPTPLPLTLFAQVRQSANVGNKRRRRDTSIDFGDVSDDETDLDVDNGKTISQSASQMITLLTYLPLILKPFATKLREVPEWIEFLKFQRMLDIIFSHSLQKVHVSELKSLIENHLAFCVRRWKKVLPKAHFLLHYPEAMLRMGPLRHYWCFAYESKHQTFKRYADTISCYKNIPKSLAYKNQLSLIPLLKTIQQGGYSEKYSEFAVHQKVYRENEKVIFCQNDTLFVGSIQSVDSFDNRTHLKFTNVNSVSFDSTVHCFVIDSIASDISSISHDTLICPLPIELYNNKYFRVISAFAVI